jgi:putative flippase GtrA
MVPHSGKLGTFGRFVVTGVFGAGLFFLLCFTLLLSGVSSAASGLLGYAGAFGATYLLQHGWSFGGASPHAQALPRYFLLQVASALLAAVLLHVAVGRFGLSHLLASLLVTFMNGALSFIVSRYWVFRYA